MTTINNEDPRVSWETVVLLVQRCPRWTTDAQVQQVYRDLAVAWERESDRPLIVRAASMFGLRSAVTGKMLFDLADAMEHERLWAAQKQAEMVVAPAAPALAPATEGETTEQEEVSTDPNVNDAAEVWHNAVKGRRVNVEASKVFRDEQIKAAKDAHTAIVEQWDAYVIATREALRKVRGN